MSKVKLAVIGLNFGKTHVRNILSGQTDGELVAICDLIEGYSDFAKECNVNFYTNYKEMLEKEKLDGVVIAVPPHVHAELSIYCLEHGVNTLVEKPVSNSLEETDKLLTAAAKSNAKLLVGHQHRFDPGVELTKKNIQSNEIGSLIGFHIYGVYAKFQDYFKEDWRNMRVTGGGPLTSNGIHDIDRIRYICGDIDTVTALMSNTYRGFEVEDTMAVSIKCKNGVVGTYYISDCSYPLTEFTDSYYTSKASIRFNCSSMYPTEGRHTFEVSTLNDASPAYYLREREIKTTIIPAHNNHLNEIEHFTKVIKGLETPRTTGEDAKKTLQALLAIVESAEKQKTIKLD